MNINGNTRCYVWDDITNVEYVSIIDGEGKEIIYPITAETERIVTKMEGAQLSTKRKDFWDAKNELYYYRNRLGNFYKVKKVDQTESFSINYYTPNDIYNGIPFIVKEEVDFEKENLPMHKI